MKGFAKLCCIAAMVCIILGQTPLKAEAADPTESLVFIAPFDSEGNPMKNVIGMAGAAGYLVRDSETMVIMTTDAAVVKGAALYGVQSMKTEGVAQAEPLVVDSALGFAMFDIKGDLPDCPALTLSAAGVETGQELYVAGMDLSMDVATLKESVYLGKTAVAGTVSDQDGNVFIRLENVFSEGFVGGPVIDESGRAVGVINRFGDRDQFTSFGTILGQSGGGQEGGQGGGSQEGGQGSGGQEGGQGSGGQEGDQGGAGQGGGGQEGGQGGGSQGSGQGGGSQGGGNQGSGQGTGMSMDDVIFYGMTDKAVSFFKFLRMLIVPAVLALIVLGSVYIKEELTRKDKGPAEFAETVRRVVSDGLSVMGLRGIFANKVFILNKPLTMGRDAGKCQVLYPQGTGGISSVHCQITPGEDGAAVMDLGSTYGTYLKDGTKLKPNVPYTLHRGDEFYLAEASNSYRIV